MSACELSEEQIATTEFLKQEAGSARDDYQYWVVGLLLGGCSFAEVSSATGLSKDMLQRWKREAGK